MTCLDSSGLVITSPSFLEDGTRQTESSFRYCLIVKGLLPAKSTGNVSLKIQDSCLRELPNDKSLSV